MKPPTLSTSPTAPLARKNLIQRMIEALSAIDAVVRPDAPSPAQISIEAVGAVATGSAEARSRFAAMFRPEEILRHVRDKLDALEASVTFFRHNANVAEAEVARLRANIAAFTETATVRAIGCPSCGNTLVVPIGELAHNCRYCNLVWGAAS